MQQWETDYPQWNAKLSSFVHLHAFCQKLLHDFFLSAAALSSTCLLSISVPFHLAWFAVRDEGGLRGGSGGGFTYADSEEAPLKGLIKFTRPPTEQRRRRNRSENICT